MSKSKGIDAPGRRSQKCHIFTEYIVSSSSHCTLQGCCRVLLFLSVINTMTIIHCFFQMLVVSPVRQDLLTV